MSIRLRSSHLIFAACVGAACLTLAAPAAADEDPLALYRDRFRLGMEKYKAGALAEAIRVWNAVYEEIGPTRGYRLSFNLARAYDTNGEATRAAERYRSFLDEVAARRRAGEAMEPIVDREASDAEERMAALNREHGRIEVAARPDATLAQVDDADPRLGAFVAYVAAGTHVVTFAPGRDDASKLEVTVAAGELVVAQAPPGLASSKPPEPAPAQPATRREVHHPISPVVLYAGAVATAASVVAPVVAYSYANSLVATYRSPTSSAVSKVNAYNDYSTAQPLAYATLAAPITLGVVTGVLTTWYFAGAHEVNVTVTGGAAPGGAGVVVFGRF